MPTPGSKVGVCRWSAAMFDAQYSRATCCLGHLHEDPCFAAAWSPPTGDPREQRRQLLCNASARLLSGHSGQDSKARSASAAPPGAELRAYPRMRPASPLGSARGPLLRLAFCPLFRRLIRVADEWKHITKWPRTLAGARRSHSWLGDARPALAPREPRAPHLQRETYRSCPASSPGCREVPARCEPAP